MAATTPQPAGKCFWHFSEMGNWNEKEAVGRGEEWKKTKQKLVSTSVKRRENERTYFHKWNQNTFHKLSQPDEGLAAKGHNHGYHSLFTKLLLHPAWRRDFLCPHWRAGYLVTWAASTQTILRVSRTGVKEQGLEPGCWHRLTVSWATCVFKSFLYASEKSVSWKVKKKAEELLLIRGDERGSMTTKCNEWSSNAFWTRAGGAMDITIKDITRPTDNIWIWSVS